MFIVSLAQIFAVFSSAVFALLCFFYHCLFKVHFSIEVRIVTNSELLRLRLLRTISLTQATIALVKI